MNLMNLDQPTRAALEYIEKLRELFQSKRQKLNNVTSALRPSSFPDISTQQLCDILIRSAYNGGNVNDTYRDHLMELVVDESLTWNQVLHSVINTKVDCLYVKSQMCDLIRDMVGFVQIKSFESKDHADALIPVLKPTLLFLTKLILTLLSDEDELDTMQINYDDEDRAYLKPLEALSALIHDDLCGALLSMQETSEKVTQQLQQCFNAFSKLHHSDELSTSLMELLVEKHEENCKPTEYQYKPEGLAVYDLKNPSIRMLVPVFSCFINHKSSKHMANIIQTFVELMRLPGDSVIFDLLHASVLLMYEEKIDLLHLPKKNRPDYRWQATTFFYKTLPLIIEHLINGGGITVEDLKIGLEKALYDLTMLLDAVDFDWQNASYLTLLNSLEHIIGEETSNSLRQRRREHMKSTATLVDFSDTDNKPIEHSDIKKLDVAIKEVMSMQCGQNDNFLNMYVKKVSDGEFEEFDAITSVLTSEGKLLEVGRAFALKNKFAQASSMLVNAEERIRVFDETFLLLSRIVIRNPGLSISMFVNGGRGKTDTELAMFFKWSMWYVKRVPKTRKDQERAEEELVLLRKEVEMLVRLLNAELGIDEEEEEEENMLEVEEGIVKQETEKVTGKTDEKETKATFEDAKNEEITEEKDKEQEGGEQQQTQEDNDEEKMDTSEVTSELIGTPASTVNPKVSDEPKETLHPVNTTGKTVSETTETTNKENNEPMVTWHQIHCPLARITKKTARVYLAVLKGGKPFWRSDDPNLNLGSILAAIPKIGELLVEEHQDKKSHKVDRKVVEDQMTNIIHGIDSMPCLFVCLVEWVDCEPDSAARTSLAVTIKNALEKRINPSTASIENNTNLSKWKFVKSTVLEMIHEIIDKAIVFPEVTCNAFSTARRFCPVVSRDEIPDQVKTKHAWIYMRQQQWTSPHALRILEHYNYAREFKSWCHMFISKTIQIQCGEIMKISVDMILAVCMTDDVNLIIRMQESLMDHWFSEDAGLAQIDGRFDSLALTAVIRLIAYVMMYAELILDRLLNDGPPLKEPLPYEEIEAPGSEDPEYREKWIYLYSSLLDRTVNRLFKILRKGVLCTVINAIIRLIKTIAGAADCKGKRLLIKRIPPEMIFQLAYIEPESVDYALMNAYCDPENEEHTRVKIMFLCAQRRKKEL
ncbi:hypothetical protein GCK72_018364 [Caenorhabditis remanei]|uniref:Uncharacterized protein n=1 Tax=Caenorhabditis remanei TaxID=31234 RepID=A0A6A5G9T7_CAERE|nr:hypothetical protein GCK72_018364 [Caenorhabditis remanei]KAF1751810.1 hypothetical protein GCK72_018364 [Caenorhabditis remanei]